jgi:hypothetical protein
MEHFTTLGQVLGFAGLNYDIIEEKLPPEGDSIYLWDGNNILIKNGRIEKIKGTDYLNDVSTQLGIASYRTVLGLPIYEKWDATKYLMAVTPRRLYYLLSDTTWTNLGTIADGDNDSVLSYANADDKFIFVLSDSGTIYYWDGTTFGAFSLTAQGVGTLKARHLVEYKTQLLLFRTIEDGTENYLRMWASNAGVLGTFSTADKLDLDAEGKIIGAKQLEESIIVYLNSSIQRVYWVSDTIGYGHIPIAGVPLYAPRTLCGDEDQHFYLSKKGLMRYVKGGRPQSISDQKFNKLILDELDPVNYPKATASFYSHLNHLYFTYPKSGSTYNDVQIIYDVSVGELVSYKDLAEDNLSGFGAYEKDLSGLSPDERQEYGMSFIPIFGNKDGYVKEQEVNVYQDTDTNYETNIVHPPTFWKDRSRNKRLMQIDLIIEKLTDEDITFVVEVANEANQNYSFEYTITGNGNTGTRRYKITSDNNGTEVDCFGKEFTVKIKDSNNPYGWKYKGSIFRGYYSTFK